MAADHQVCGLHRGRVVRYDLSLAERSAVGAVVDDWIRSLWNVSRGTCGSPFSNVPCPSAVCPLHILPVYVDRPAAAGGLLQRGAAFSVNSIAFDQILTLLNASLVLPVEAGVRVQLARNVGGLCLRPSSCALKRDDRGRLPSLKSISPIQSESDSLAFGTRAAKEDGHRQITAWRMNNDLIRRYGRIFAAARRGNVCRGAKECSTPSAALAQLDSASSTCQEQRICERCLLKRLRLQMLVSEPASQAHDELVRPVDDGLLGRLVISTSSRSEEVVAASALGGPRLRERSAAAAAAAAA